MIIPENYSGTFASVFSSCIPCIIEYPLRKIRSGSPPSRPYPRQRPVVLQRLRRRSQEYFSSKEAMFRIGLVQVRFRGGVGKDRSQPLAARRSPSMGPRSPQCRSMAPGACPLTSRDVRLDATIGQRVDRKQSPSGSTLRVRSGSSEQHCRWPSVPPFHSALEFSLAPAPRWPRTT